MLGLLREQDEEWQGNVWIRRSERWKKERNQTQRKIDKLGKKDESVANLFQLETQKVVEPEFNEMELQESKCMIDK
jgi:hypothetical protein